MRDIMLELILFSSLNGVLYGMLLFMMAGGLTLIFSMMGVLNFAHASFYMLGAYFGFEIARHLGFWIGLFAAPLLVGLVGALIERYGLRQVHKHGHVAELLFTFGLAFVIEELVQMIWGKLPVDYRVPEALDFVAFTMFGTTYPAYKVFMLCIAIGMFIALLWVLTKNPYRTYHSGLAEPPADSCHVGPQCASNLHVGFRRWLRLGWPRRRDCGTSSSHPTIDGSLTRPNSFCGCGARRFGISDRRIHCLTAHRPGTDICSSS